MKDKNRAGADGFSVELSSEHFARVQSLARMGSWRLNLRSGMIDATEEARRIFGVGDADLSLDFVQSRALPEYRPMLDQALERLINEQVSYDVEYALERLDNKEIKYIRSMAEYDADSGIITGAIQDITRRKLVEQALAESEQRYRSLFDNSVSGIVYCDTEGRVLEANRKMLELLGSPSLEETKKINMLTFPVLIEVGFSADLRLAIDTGREVFNSTLYTSKWGSRLHLEYALTPLYSGDRVAGIMGKIDDITKRKEAEAKIEALLAEKDIILREVHHRIKNNMASIEALLKLQLDNTPEEDVRSGLQEAVGRLSSMRVLYEKLYQSDNFIQTSCKAYLSKLIDDIAEVFPESSGIEFRKQLDDFMIPSDITFSLGIIINELMTNALKYAFKTDKKDKYIQVSAENRKGSVMITVRDNGAGYADLQNCLTSKGFGLQLIRMLSEQIGGEAEFANDGGAVFSISFKI